MTNEFFNEPYEINGDTDSGKLNEKTILSICQTDYVRAMQYTSARMDKIHKWRREYKGLPYGNERPGERSTFISRDIKKYSAWLQSQLIDPFISTPDIVKCYPAIPTSTKAAQASEVVLNSQFCRQFNRFNFMSKVVSVLEVDGTCVIKTGWDYAEDKRRVKYTQDIPLSIAGTPLQEPIPDEIMQQLMQEDPEQAQILQMVTTPLKDELGRQQFQHLEEEREEVVPVINQPTAIVCRNEDIFIDPTCLGDWENAQFIIHRYETNLSDLKSDGRYKNLDQIRIPESGPNDSNYIRRESFSFVDKVRKKLLVYEYWGNLDVNGDGIAEPMIVAWVNNVIIRCEPNPYPDKKPPFIITPMLPRPFDVYGEPNACLLSENQKVKTAIYRGIIDGLQNSNNGQVAYLKGSIDEENKKRMLSGENFEINGDPRTAIFPMTYGNLPQAIFNIIQMIDSENTQLTGVNTFGNQPQTNRIGNDNASRGQLDGGNMRKLQLVKSIAENLVKPLLRKWLEYDAWLLEDEQVFRLTGGDHFEIIKRDDLYGRIEVDLTISTNEDNAVRTNQLAFLLQTIGPNEDPNIRKMIMAEIMRLHKMPEFATRIETYEPKPDPYAEMAKQLELERMRAEIMELQANAGKIEQDGILKSAKAQAEGTRAGLTKAQTDKVNLDFIQQQQGYKENIALLNTQLNNESKERIAQMKNDADMNKEYMKQQGEAEKMQYEIEKARIDAQKAETQLKKAQQTGETNLKNRHEPTAEEQDREIRKEKPKK